MKNSTSWQLWHGSINFALKSVLGSASDGFLFWLEDKAVRKLTELQIRKYCQQQKYSARTLVSGDTSFMGLFAAVSEVTRSHDRLQPPFDCHASNVARACNYHTRALRHVCSLLTDETAQTGACSIVASRFDYCNALLCGAPAETLN